MKFLFCLAVLTFACGLFAGEPKLTLDPNPPAPGENRWLIQTIGTDGKLIDVENLDVGLAMAAMGSMPAMAEQAVIAPKSRGTYEAQVNISMGGSWELTIAYMYQGKREVYRYTVTTGVGMTFHNMAAMAPTEEENHGTQIAVGVDRLQKSGVRFETAKMHPLQKIIRAVGTVARDASTFDRSRLTDSNRSYVVARLFPQDLSLIKTNQSVEMILPSGERAIGKIESIYPSNTEGDGTARVRIRSALNPSLQTGQFVDVRLPIEMGTHLTVPVTALLYSGLHQYVFVDRGNGILEPREVHTVFSTADWVAIRSGLKAGERIASAGTFLISSEAQMKSALPKWSDTTE